jgi:hypothetical protein
MDMSDVLNTSMLRNGFFRYLSSVDPGSLFQPWTLIKTPYRMELFFNAIWWEWPLSHTEESDGALSFSNSVGTNSHPPPPTPEQTGKGQYTIHAKYVSTLRFSTYSVPDGGH